MSIKFYKYQGAGNDFIMLNNIKNDKLKLTTKQIATICHRRFGIGADGLIILEPSDKYDFNMVYYNSDGKEGSMCGNGGRCVVKFAYDLGIILQKTVFSATDGKHEAYVMKDGNIALKMSDVKKGDETPWGLYFNTGSPHLLVKRKNISSINVYDEGKKLRYEDYFTPEGTNVNFFEINNEIINLRTYERGVEEETWACGTGSVATALGAYQNGLILKNHDVKIVSKGGVLSVSFEQKEDNFQNIWLLGPAVNVFNGQIQQV